MPDRLVHHETPMEYFRGLVEVAMAHQGVRSSDDTTFYVVNLLSGFVQPDPNGSPFGAEPLAVRLARALQSGGSAQRESLRRVGDLSLFISGFFADSLTRKLVDVDYYVTMGGYAYSSLSRLDDEACSAIFAELAQKFVAFVDILSEVSERTSLSSNTDLLRLYDRWLRTGSRRNGELLVERGIVPNASIRTGRVQ